MAQSNGEDTATAAMEREVASDEFDEVVFVERGARRRAPRAVGEVEEVAPRSAIRIGIVHAPRWQAVLASGVRTRSAIEGVRRRLAFASRSTCIMRSASGVLR